MPFEPGQSGNPDGRPRGTQNKLNTRVKGFITALLEENFDSVQASFASLDGKDKVRCWIDLLPYAVPKLQSMSAEVAFEKLSDEDLDEIIERLKQGA
jgi:hypothetical protein